MFRVSQYKFFAPHLGVLYGRYQPLDQLRAYKVRPADDVPPHKFETGTKNHEGLAGTTAAINYLADLAAKYRRGPAEAMAPFPLSCRPGRRAD